MSPEDIIELYILETDVGVRNSLANAFIKIIIENPVSEKWDFDLKGIGDELWAPIKGFEGYYEVSNFGRLKKLPTVKYNLLGNQRKCISKERISSFYSKSGNYPHTYLRAPDGSRKRVSIHIEVAKAFVPNPEGKPFVNHKDGHKDNPKWYNLEWSSVIENNNHAKLSLLNKNNGEDSPMSLLTNEEAIFICNSELPTKYLSDLFKVSTTTIIGIRNGKNWNKVTGKKYIKKKLSKESVIEIYNSRLPNKELSKKFGVTENNIYLIKTGRSWASLRKKL